jgi:hypothetical protein
MSDDDDKLLDFGDYPEIQADGGVYSAGGRTNVVLFKWRKFEGKLRRVIVGELHPSSAKQQWLKPPNERGEAGRVPDQALRQAPGRSHRAALRRNALSGALRHSKIAS